MCSNVEIRGRISDRQARQGTVALTTSQHGRKPHAVLNSPSIFKGMVYNSSSQHFGTSGTLLNVKTLHSSYEMTCSFWRHYLRKYIITSNCTFVTLKYNFYSLSTITFMDTWKIWCIQPTNKLGPYVFSDICSSPLIVISSCPSLPLLQGHRPGIVCSLYSFICLFNYFFTLKTKMY